MSEEDCKRKSRQPECARCRNHGVLSPLRGHKRFCHFATCVCTSCVIIVQKQKVSREQIALRRRQAQDEAAGLCLPVPETLLLGRGKNSQVATNLRALNQKFPNINLGRLHAVLKESGSLKHAVARLQREELNQNRTDTTWSHSTTTNPISTSSQSPAPSYVRQALPTSNDFTSRRYFTTQPPLYNDFHMYTLPPYCKTNNVQNPYAQSYESGEYPTQQGQYLIHQTNQAPWTFSDVNYTLSMADSSKNLSEYSSLPNDDGTAGRISPEQAASTSAAFANPSPNTISSDDEGPLMIDC